MSEQVILRCAACRRVWEGAVFHGWQCWTTEAMPCRCGVPYTTDPAVTWAELDDAALLKHLRILRES